MLITKHEKQTPNGVRVYTKLRKHAFSKVLNLLVDIKN